MITENLIFLVNINNEHIYLIPKKIEEVKNPPEINLDKMEWKDPEWGWLKIGEKSGTGEIRFVFDPTNFEHIKKAFEVIADFHR